MTRWPTRYGRSPDRATTAPVATPSFCGCSNTYSVSKLAHHQSYSAQNLLIATAKNQKTDHFRSFPIIIALRIPAGLHDFPRKMNVKFGTYPGIQVAGEQLRKVVFQDTTGVAAGGFAHVQAAIVLPVAA